MSRSSICFALSTVLLASAARADVVDATITTLLAGQRQPRDGQIYTVVPAYESLSLVADLQAPHLDDLKLAISGWGLAAFGDPADGKTVSGDLDLGYLEAKAWKRRITVRVGRQLVVGGAARITQLDGALIEARLFHGLGVTAYGGAPVTPRFGTSRGDAAGGARLFYRHSFDTEVGLSFIDVIGVGRPVREDLALDARWSPHRTLTLTGYGLWSLREARIAEATAMATWQPVGELQIAADYRRVAPDLFLPLNSVLAVFSQETRDEAGGTLFVRPVQRVRLYADYHFISDAGGTGHRASGKVTVQLGADASTTVGAEGRLLILSTNGYQEARLFGTERLPRDLFVAVDLDAYHLQQPINGDTLSFTAAATVGWDFAAGWRAAITGFADVTPFVDPRFEILARLVYQHTLHFREAK
jgi:hypothetical protein